jgi:hypothetical protein
LPPARVSPRSTTQSGRCSGGAPSSSSIAIGGRLSQSRLRCIARADSAVGGLSSCSSLREALPGAGGKRLEVFEAEDGRGTPVEALAAAPVARQTAWWGPMSAYRSR